MNLPSYSRSTALKTVRPHHLKPVCDMLDDREKYKTLASRIKKRNGRYMFSSEEIERLDNEFMHKGSPSKTVFSRWKYENPNVGAVITLLEKCRLLREAEYMTEHWLKEKYSLDDEDTQASTQSSVDFSTVSGHFNLGVKDPKEHDETVESLDASYPISDRDETTLIKQGLHSHSGMINGIQYQPVKQEGCVQDFTYEELRLCTDDFNTNPLHEGGKLIGRGGFAQVFLGVLNGCYVAVKKMTLDSYESDVCEYQYRQFEAEFNVLSGLKHRNLLTVLGKCMEESCLCIVSEYMENGSLEDRLACQKTLPLTIPQRLSILVGAGEGLCYLHQNGKIHRDVKSANVLLSHDLTPKVADCGLTRPGPSDPLHSHVVTDTITGTRGYMPPEYYEGKVSVKMDAFAFGVVILEVLTGQSNYNASRKETYLKRYVQENCESSEEIMNLIDPKCGPWDEHLAVELFQMASELYQDNRKVRKEISDIMPSLKQLWEISKTFTVY